MNAHQSRLAGCAAAAAAALMLAAPAYADGMPRGSLKDPPKERCSYTANVDITTDYIFRGFSQTGGKPTVQGGFDATCGIFYAGVWASGLDFGALAPDRAIATTEMDWYAGIKPVTGKITWDIGVIYYTYPGSASLNLFLLPAKLNYVELKVGASAEIWKDGTLSSTVFFSPDYIGESGRTWTFETTFAQVLPKVGIFTPTFSATYGYQKGTNNLNYLLTVGNFEDSYSYWNAGLTLGFRDKWSLDFRYWDTNVKDDGVLTNFCTGGLFQCDSRYVATLKFAY